MHAHLDAGSDPLADDALVDALSVDADLLAQVARLVDDVAALRTVDSAGPRTSAAPIPTASAPVATASAPVATASARSHRAASRAVPWLLAAAALVAVALSFPRPAPPARLSPTPPGRPPGTQARAAPGRVLAFRAAVAERSGGVPGEGPVVRTSEHTLALQPGGRVASRRRTTVTWSPSVPSDAERPAILSYRAHVAEE